MRATFELLDRGRGHLRATRTQHAAPHGTHCRIALLIHNTHTQMRAVGRHSAAVSDDAHAPHAKLPLN